MASSRRAAALAVSAVYVAHGAVFVAPPAKARLRMADGPLLMWQFRALGAAEIVGGLVFSLPPADGRRDWLRKAAGLCLLAVSVPATVLHARKSEATNTAFTATLTAATLCALPR